MSNAPLMPKATAVWLVENTSLTFDQIADFCKLHPLEVKGIADGEVAAGIAATTRSPLASYRARKSPSGETNPEHRLQLVDLEGAGCRKSSASAGRATRRCRAARTAPTRFCGCCAIIPS